MGDREGERIREMKTQREKKRNREGRLKGQAEAQERTPQERTPQERPLRVSMGGPEVPVERIYAFLRGS